MSNVLVYTFFNPHHLTFKILRSLDLGLVDGGDNCIDSRLPSFVNNFGRAQRGNDIGMSVDKYYLGNLNSLAKHILETKPQYVLGLGDFRKDGKNIRVENVFVNKYGRNKIVENGKEKYLATWKIPEQNKIVFSQLGSWGPCNRSGYILSKVIEDNNLDTKLAFIHVPSSYPQVVVTKTLNGLLMCLDSKK